MHEQISRKATSRQSDAAAVRRHAIAGTASPSLAAPACACGGTCPRCRDRGVPVGRSDAVEESHAESFARQVSGGLVRPGVSRPAPVSQVTRDSLAWQALQQPGRPLEPAVRRPLAGLVRRDLAEVRVHDGALAEAGANALGTLAYSLGPHIVMGARSAQLSPLARQHLLAHEIAHGTQPGSERTIRRAGSDWLIEGLPPDAPGDTGSIYFERGSSTIPASESVKIPALAVPPLQNLTLHGFTSEDDSAVVRSTVITARLDAVEAALKAAGHVGVRARVPHPNAGVGDVDYRHKRAVQVLPTPSGLLSAPTTVNQCGAAGSIVASGAALTRCNTAFSTAFPVAVSVVNRAELDIVTTPTPAANAVVTRFFSGVPRADVNANVSAIAAQVRQLNAAHRCHTDCDGGCDRPAYNAGTGLGASGSMMTICPDFVTAPADFQVNTLIHESAHANPRESIDDIAYSNTRLIPFLLAADARRNTDSYVLLMRLVHNPGSMPVGPASADTLTGMTGAGVGSDTEQTQRSVAWLESWLNYGDFDTGLVHETINASLSAGAWVTGGTNEFNIQTMHRLATAFTPELTDPGVDGAPRTTPPTNNDKLRVAAIHDRFDQLYDIFNQRPISVTRGAPGSTDVWGRTLTMPFLTQNVTLSPGFFALSRLDQVRRLALLMVHAHLGISSGFEAKYVQAIDLIHLHRGLGP